MTELLVTVVVCIAVWLGFAYLGPTDGDRERLREYAAIQGIKLGTIRPAPLYRLINLNLSGSRSGPRFFSVQFTEANGRSSKAVIALDLDYLGQIREVRKRVELA
jgi:hypothetical protein